jgi:hypothetical protein
MKAENDVDVPSEEDSTGIKTDEVYIPSAFSIKNAEPEVTLVFSYFCVYFVCVSVCMYAHVYAHTHVHVCICIYACLCLCFCTLSHL